MLQFKPNSCRKYTSSPIAECRCQKIATSFGVFSRSRFLPLDSGHQGHCQHRTWHDDILNQVVLLVVLREGQQCWFVCEADLSHDSPRVRETFRLNYTIIRRLSDIHVLARFYTQLIRIWFCATVAGLLLFCLVLTCVYIQSQRHVYICNAEIHNLLRARQRRAVSSDRARRETESVKSSRWDQRREVE